MICPIFISCGSSGTGHGGDLGARAQRRLSPARRRASRVGLFVGERNSNVPPAMVTRAGDDRDLPRMWKRNANLCPNADRVRQWARGHYLSMQGVRQLAKAYGRYPWGGLRSPYGTPRTPLTAM